MFDIKKYDKRLDYRKDGSGGVTVVRVSPFNSTREHFLFEIKNEFIGSGRWIKNRLIKSDSHRFDIVGNSLRNNRRIRSRRTDTRQLSREVADLIESGGDIFVN